MWKVYKDKGQNGKYRQMKTLRSGSRNLTVRGLKKNRNYRFLIKGYDKKKGKYRNIYRAGSFIYTGLATPDYDEYYMEAEQGPSYIDISFETSTQGMRPEGRILYRREAGTKNYQKIATVKWRKGTYRDKNVKVGQTYYYKFRIYKKIGKKRRYSKWSEKVARSAVNQKGAFSAFIAESSRDKIIVNLTSQWGNALLVVNSEDISYMYGDAENQLCIINYQLDGYTRDGRFVPISAKQNSQIKLDVSETVSLTYKRTGTAPESMDGITIRDLSTETAIYNKMVSFFDTDFANGRAEARENPEYIH